jgi:hypothetical protein
MIFLHAMLIMQFLVYLFVYIVNPHELGSLMQVSLIKRTLQILPLTMLIASINLLAIFFNTDSLKDPG